MFAFLTRLGRLLVVTLVLGVTASVLGFGVLTFSPVASKHHGGGSAGAAACTLTGTSVGAALTLTGSGYAPSTSYAAEFQWPNGTAGSFPANSDGSGAIKVSTYAWWAGTYHASVYSTSNHSTLMASCAITIS
jgi:hypothetical protein